ncbi:MAG: RNA polymerase sigma factor, partial [Thermomicrobium sp.]
VGKALVGTFTTILVGIGVVGGWLALGTAPVTVVTRECPPLALELDGAARAMAQLLGVPSQFLPDQPVGFRLPVGRVGVRVTRDEAEFALVGIPVRIQFAAPVVAVSWDGLPLLDQKDVNLSISRGSKHTIELVCS